MILQPPVFSHVQPISPIILRIETIEKQLAAEKQAKIDAVNAQKAAEAALAVQQAQAVVAAQQVAYVAPVYASSCVDAKSCIYMHESGNNPGAVNASSGACGLGQALPCSKMGCSLSDYACEDAFFDRYAISVYGSWNNAWAFWQSHSWW